MPVDPDRLEVERLRNLVKAFGWALKCLEKTDTELVITFTKPRIEPIPEEAVGAD